MKIDFSTYQLIINNEVPCFDSFRSLLSQNDIEIKVEEFYYIFNFKQIEQKFIWIYAKYGKPKPRTKKVRDLNKNTDVDNPRLDSQVEMRQQIFALYDLKNNQLLINNSKKLSVLEKVLSDVLKAEIYTKNLYKSIDEFISKIRDIKKIKFTGYRNLFSSRGDLFKGIKDVFAFEEPEEFSIEADYNLSITEGIKQQLRKFNILRTDNEIKSLVCIGRDEKGIESIFNTDSFIQKYSIEVEKNEEDIFEVESVKNSLILELSKGVN